MVNMRAPQFDWKINLGHLLSIGSILVVGLLGWVNLRRDVMENTAANAGQAAQIAGVLDRLAVVDLGRVRIEGQLDRLDERMTEVRDQLKSLNEVAR